MRLLFLFLCDVDHRVLYVLTHSFPTRGASELASKRSMARRVAVKASMAAVWRASGVALMIGLRSLWQWRRGRSARSSYRLTGPCRMCPKRVAALQEDQARRLSGER